MKDEMKIWIVKCGQEILSSCQQIVYNEFWTGYVLGKINQNGHGGQGAYFLFGHLILARINCPFHYPMSRPTSKESWRIFPIPEWSLYDFEYQEWHNKIIEAVWKKLTQT